MIQRNVAQEDSTRKNDEILWMYVIDSIALIYALDDDDDDDDDDPGLEGGRWYSQQCTK